MGYYHHKHELAGVGLAAMTFVFLFHKMQTFQKPICGILESSIYYNLVTGCKQRNRNTNVSQLIGCLTTTYGQQGLYPFLLRVYQHLESWVIQQGQFFHAQLMEEYVLEYPMFDWVQTLVTEKAMIYSMDNFSVLLHLKPLDDQSCSVDGDHLERHSMLQFRINTINWYH